MWDVTCRLLRSCSVPQASIHSVNPAIPSSKSCTQPGPKSGGHRKIRWASLLTSLFMQIQPGTGVRVGVTVRGTPGEPQKHLHWPSFEGSKQQRTWRASHEIRPLSTNLISQVAYRRAKGRAQRNPAGITTYRGKIMTLQELGSLDISKKISHPKPRTPKHPECTGRRIRILSLNVAGWPPPPMTNCRHG